MEIGGAGKGGDHDAKRMRAWEERPRRLLHGADWFPEQWLDRPDIIDADVAMMKQARCGAVSLGMFAWSALEPEEGRYCFDWLDRTMDLLAGAGIQALLATPSGARPAWMSQRYPEILRTGPDRRRNLHGYRHNHCFTSPAYREKTCAMNTRLAERYGRHPALLMWHVSNEYGGECHCGLCQDAFRSWLKRKYDDDIDALNRAWWASFWSHTCGSWDQVESPAPHGEPWMQGLIIDWKRFVTDQAVDFMRAECAPLRRLAPGVPVTHNMMGTYPGLNYWRMAPHLDVASWNSYPCWHGVGPAFDGGFPWDPEGRDWVTASDTGFTHDLVRSLKNGRPFLLMESAPTFSSWHTVWKLKKPGMHSLSSLLAIAHGADGVQYFQWRKSRGGPEQFHGAVVGHDGGGGTRVFAEVAELGDTLASLSDAAGAGVPAETAIIFDWENRWALESARVAPPAGDGAYEATCKRHYRPLWSAGVGVDVIDMDQDLSCYRLLAAPLLYMVRPGIAERLQEFVRRGGVLVTTHDSGIVDENDLCFLGGFPAPLRSLLGVSLEETDGLYPVERNRIIMSRGNLLGMRGAWELRRRCALVSPESAAVVGTYGQDFYQGRPALTVNRHGKGMAFFLAADAESAFLESFYGALIRLAGVRRATTARLPRGVTARLRATGERELLFLMNFTSRPHAVAVPDFVGVDAITGAPSPRRLRLGPFGFRVLARGVQGSRGARGVPGAPGVRA